MLTVRDALLGIALPAVVAAVLLLLGRLLGGGRWTAPLALGCGYLAGHVGVRGWRGWQPREATDWIAVGAAAGLLLGVFGLTRRGPSALRLTVRFAAAFALAWLVAGRSLARDGLGAALGEMALVSAAAALAWSRLEARGLPVGEDRPEPRPSSLEPLVLLIAASCTALCLGLSATIVLARLAGALAATLGAAMVGTRLRLAPALFPRAAGGLVLTLLGLLLTATTHATLPVSCAVLLSLAALVPLPGGATGTDVAPRGRHGWWSLLSCALLGGAAIGIAFAASPPLDF